MSKLFIPRESVLFSKGPRSWITANCREAIGRKCQASGTDRFLEESMNCSRVLTKAYVAFVAQLKLKMFDSSTTSKKWWSVTKTLSDNTKGSSAIPLLRVNKEWVLNSKAKADAFAKVFHAKNALVAQTQDLNFGLLQPTQFIMHPFITMRRRKVFQTL